jgi:hypothetical protein
MLTAGHVLIAFAVLTAWIGSLWLHPFGRCPRCRGRRVVIKARRRKPRGQRPPKPPWPVTCKSCKGIGRRQRIGSRTVHRTARRIRREMDRQRKQHQAAAAASQED